ncbi:MAG: tetratricopeptide repeat protein [Methanomicrobiaceae archaeon]|nr:tetratricopeptide repeat protein [Methanomicrobiaceae archaeon]MDD5420193.1 tetratricopeptide repeat protein [Methanomicrobiaceae archaeon]
MVSVRRRGITPLFSGLLLLGLLAAPATASPATAEAWLEQGHSYYAMGMYDEALESYDRALAQNSDLFEAHVARGNVLDRLGRYGEAIESYDDALAINPDDHHVWSLRENARLNNDLLGPDGYDPWDPDDELWGMEEPELWDPDEDFRDPDTLNDEPIPAPLSGLLPVASLAVLTGIRARCGMRLA